MIILSEKSEKLYWAKGYLRKLIRIDLGHTILKYQFHNLILRHKIKVLQLSLYKSDNFGLFVASINLQEEKSK
jgi:hypothetical protein